MGGLQRVLRHRFALLAVFNVCSLAAVSIGALICVQSDVPTALWARNLVAWVLGAVVAVGLAVGRRTEVLHVALWAAPLAVLATFFSPAQEDVHRWIDAGPLHINAAMFVLPAMVVALAVLSRERVWSWVPAFATLTLLVLQPDASQATSLAAVMAVIAAVAPSRPLLRVAVIVGATALATAAWFQADPLQPVPEVEDILELAFAIAPSLALAAIVALLLTAICPDVLMRYQRETPRTAAWALSVCFLAWIATTYFGAYPVPWVGIGPSPIIGAWLGVGLLVGLPRGADQR